MNARTLRRAGVDQDEVPGSQRVGGALRVGADDPQLQAEAT